MKVAKIYYADLRCLREGKYHALSETDVAVSDWKELKPDSPYYFFIPRDEKLLGEYECGWKMTKVLALPMRATHYQRITVALQETIRLMKEIDELIPGWPIE